MLALWVILHHLTGGSRMLEPWVQLLPAPAQALVHGGFVAVSTFFVLSGFVLALGYRRTVWHRSDLVRYAVARYARVYPVYLLSLLIVAPIIADHVLRTDRADDVAMLANYGLVLQGWTGTLPVHWNTPAWSLSCEMFFYLCFPLLAFALRSLRWPGLAVACVAALLLPVVFMYAGIPDHWKPLVHLGDFLIGMTAAEAYLALRERFPYGYCLYLPAAAMGMAFIANPSLCTPFAMPAAIRPLNAILITGLALGGGFGARALSTRAAILLGKASYAMYILHIPILWWFKRTWIYSSGRLSHPESALIYVGAVVMVSVQVFRRVEEPATRMIRNWGGQTPRA